MSAEKLKNLIDAHDVETVASSGMDVGETTRAASFLQKDGARAFAHSLQDGVEIDDIRHALTTIPEAKACYGTTFGLLGREYPQDTDGGYFIRVAPGADVALPIQACLLLKEKAFKQRVHNIIIIGEGARVHIITGCSAAVSASEGFHLGISEFFVHRGAYLNFTMVHSWRDDVSVKPMSIALVDEGATFISNYICLKPVRDITMYPTAVLQGPHARASFNSLILSHPETVQDIGSRVILRASDTKAEIVSRAVSLGGEVVARGHIKAEAPDVKAHLECRGLVLTERGVIRAIPEMETAYRDVDLSHEAAIGRINRDEIEYLCSRGMSYDQAQSVIIRGFMDVGILGLPDTLAQEIGALEEKTLHGTV